MGTENEYLGRLRGLLCDRDIAGSIDLLCDHPGIDQDVVGRQFVMDHLAQAGLVYCQTIKFYRERMHGNLLICGDAGNQSSRSRFHFVPRNSLLIGISTCLNGNPHDWENLQTIRPAPITVGRSHPRALEESTPVFETHIFDPWWYHMGDLMEPIPGGQMIWVNQDGGEETRVELELVTVLGGRR